MGCVSIFRSNAATAPGIFEVFAVNAVCLLRALKAGKGGEERGGKCEITLSKIRNICNVKLHIHFTFK